MKGAERRKKIDRIAYHIKDIIEEATREMIKNKRYTISESDTNYRHAEFSICLSDLLEKSEIESFFSVASEVVPRLKEYFKYEDSELIFSDSITNYILEDNNDLPIIKCQLNITMNSPRVDDQLTVYDIGSRSYKNYRKDIDEYLDNVLKW